MTTRHTLEVALAKAEARLNLAVKELAAVGANKEGATEHLTKARTACREARAALNSFERAHH